eukprot:gene11037-12202_t
MNLSGLLLTAILASSFYFKEVTCSIPTWTKLPPRKQFVIQGSTTFLNWTYNSSASVDYGKWGIVGESTRIATLSSSGNIIVYRKPNFELIKPATLKLINVTSLFSKTYYCDLSFSDGTELKDEANFIVVKSAPSFTSSLPKKTNTTEGSSELKLTVVVKGDQIPIVTWFRNGNMANISFPVTTTTNSSNAMGEIIVQSILTISHPNRTSSSLFEVKATYGDHSPVSSTSTFMDVWYGVENEKFASTKSGFAVGRNEYVIIECAASSNPAPKFTIYKNTTMVISNSANGIYVINSFSESDAGNYSCVIQNEVNNKTLEGVWFTYNQSKIVYPTASTTVTTNTSNTFSSSPTSSTSAPAPRTSTPWYKTWWVWLAIGLAIFALVAIIVVVFCWRRRKLNKRKKTKKFSGGDFLDSCIQNTPYHLGYEHGRGGYELDEQNQSASLEQNEVTHPTEADQDHELARENLGVRFESEHDLIEHYIQRPEPDEKDIDPFESDNEDLHTPISFENNLDEHGIHYENEVALNDQYVDDANGSESPLRVDLDNSNVFYDENIITYDI